MTTKNKTREAPTEMHVRFDGYSTDEAVASFHAALRRYAIRHRKSPVPALVCVSFADALELKNTPACSESGDALTTWAVLGMYCNGISAELTELPPPVLVARYEAEVRVPRPLQGNQADALAKDFNKAWGYEDGQVNRDQAYPGEVAEYGLGGHLVPVKWPAPVGMDHALWRVGASTTVGVIVEIFSDGSKRLKIASPIGAKP